MQNTNRAQESGYKASLTREQFLFHEMRIVAKQMVQGEDLASMIQIIAANNLFQYPTERMTAGMVRACYRRLSCSGALHSCTPYLEPFQTFHYRNYFNGDRCCMDYLFILCAGYTRRTPFHTCNRNRMGFLYD